MDDSSYRDLIITAKDTAKMFEYIYDKEFYTKYLTDSIYEDRISLGVPGGVIVIHKVGTDTGVWADAGIIDGIKPFVLVILNKGVKREEAVKFVPEITKMIWRYENSLLY
jgi:hypothetical protein